jgi:rhodanese-related sulfurtransferase
MSPGGPWDVRAHQLDDPTFPHDSTVDQLYTDQKFESYRALGAEAGRHAVERMNDVAPGGPRKLLAPEADCALPPQRVRELLDTATVQLVDLREDFAYGVARIDGARHIELAKLPESNGGLRKEHPVVFHCGEGVRSCEVATQYRRDGWNAFHLEGGIRRWIDDGFPVDRTPKEAAAANGG